MHEAKFGIGLHESRRGTTRLTDEELRAYLKPRHNWIAIGGFTLALLASAAALARWAFTAPTRDDYSGIDLRTKAIEVDHAVLKANVDGMRNDLGDVKMTTKTINETLMQLRLERRR